jgi:microcystin-dependent protein
MAKITVNTLPSATTPLTGAEELLVVQGGVEKKVVSAQLVLQGVSETITGVKTFASPPAVPTPSGANDATPKSYVDGVAAGAPIGSMLMWAAATAPTGYLLCNGAAVSRTTYADLFTAIGTTWGSGDGSTTFSIPDMRGAAPAGVGTSTGYTQNETIALGTKYNDQMQQITGSVETPGFASAYWTNTATVEGAFQKVTSSGGNRVLGRTDNNESGFRTLAFDSANSPGARTGDTTHSPAMSVHLYIHGGRYVA